MTSKSYPSPEYNGGDLTDDEYESLAVEGYMMSGLVGVPSMQPLVYADNTGMHVKFRGNRSAIVTGQRWVNDADDVVVPVGANSGSTRVDLATLRNVRADQQIIETVVAGTSGSGAPSPVQDAPGSGVWDLPCANVTIPHGATSITGDMVTPVAWYLGEGTIFCNEATKPPHKQGRRIRCYDSKKSYESDGTKWLVQQEATGWVAVSAVSGSGWTTVSYVNRVNGVVFVRFGTPIRSGGTLGTDDSKGNPTSRPSSVLAQIPVGFRPGAPAGTPPHWVGYSVGNECKGFVGTDGKITLDAYTSAPIQPSQGITIADISYPAEG